MIVAQLTFDTNNTVQFIKEILSMKQNVEGKASVWMHRTVNQEVRILVTGDIEEVKQKVYEWLEIRQEIRR